MPEDDPGTCTGDNADAVAAYIYDAFYSKTAQERNRPARVELARLTVRQYRNAVADLIGSFRESGNWGDVRGLDGEYFKTRRMGDGNRRSSGSTPRSGSTSRRTAPTSRRSSPRNTRSGGRGRCSPPRRANMSSSSARPTARGSGSTTRKKPLIDAWVQSGKDTEHRGTIRLLGGRAYPIRLEFAKGKDGRQGQGRQEEGRGIEPASIALEWKRPGRVVEVIPAQGPRPGPDARDVRPGDAVPAG